MFELIGFAAAVAAAAVGYIQTRGFVRRRLAYVEAVHTGPAPILAGLGAAVIAMPLVALLPLVGGGTALLFGAGVGAGVASGSKEARRRRLGA